VPPCPPSPTPMVNVENQKRTFCDILLRVDLPGGTVAGVVIVVGSVKQTIFTKYTVFQKKIAQCLPCN